MYAILSSHSKFWNSQRFREDVSSWLKYEVAFQDRADHFDLC